jgi:hypothetical protein
MDKLTLEIIFARADEEYLFDEAQGAIYQCQEKRCCTLKPHAHTKRPYLIMRNNPMLPKGGNRIKFAA